MFSKMNALCVLIVALSCFTFQFVTGNSNALQNAMKSNSVIPDVVPKAPKNVINATYSDGVRVNLGNKLTIPQTNTAPEVRWPFESGAKYALFMVDPDAPSRQNPVNAQWLHWFVVNIAGNSVSNGKVMQSYYGPAPPAGTGFHRYVLLVFKQKQNQRFTAVENRSKFNVTEYAKANRLGKLIAANFFQVQRN